MDYLNQKIKNIFVINDNCGSGKVKDFLFYLSFLPSVVQKENLCLFTKKRGDATNLASVFSKKYPTAVIYSVGGDGTLNEVVNGLNRESKLAILPFGTGNDFYRVYKNIIGTKKIDIGTINDRKFINIASIGMDADIANNANEYKLLHKFKNYEYTMGIIKSLCINPHYMTDKGNISLLAVCNGKYYGNGIAINPNYNLNDGQLDMYQVNDLGRLQFIRLFLKIFKSTHYKDANVFYDKIGDLSINTKLPLICNVDGEIIYLTNISFKCLKNYLTLTTDVPKYINEYVLRYKRDRLK